MPTTTPPTTQRYIRDADVARRYGVGRATVWRWVREGELPPPIQLGRATTRWSLDVLEDFERRREAAR